MKMLLLRPHAGHIGKVIPLGLLAVASVLKRAGHEVRILDLRISIQPDEDLKNALEEFNPEYVGIGLMTIEAEHAFATAAQVKSLKKDVTVIFGGPHCSHDPQYILHDPNVDLLVVGEAEITIIELFDALKNNTDLSMVKGIAYRKDSKYCLTPERSVIKDLDWVNQEYGLINVEDYFEPECSTDFLPATKRFMSIVTSRGCPFKCTYCHDLFGKSIQYRSPEVVLDEMEHLIQKYGVQEFQILDDVFNVNMKRCKQILSMMAERKLNVKVCFPNGVRADFFDNEMIQIMRAAGVYRLALGIESGSERILEMIDKKLDIGIIDNVVRDLAKSDISVHGFFMLGFPGETREEMDETIRFACNLDLATANFSLVTPNPGTKLRETLAEEKQLQNKEFSQYTFDVVNSNESKLNATELLTKRKAAYRLFYLNPKRLWRIFQTTHMKKLLFAKSPFTLLWRNAFSSN
ncbi:MAG: radical SAM protein [Nitrospinota bacterium]|nr:radical SAM protein [Nitrospinota bacterium]